MNRYKRKHTKRHVISMAVLIVLIGLYVATDLSLPIKALSPYQTNSTLDITTPSSNLPWPHYGEGAIGLSNGSVIQTHGALTPRPIASVAKLITAIAVLQKYPLKLNQQGPMITIDAEDYSIYTKYIAEQGSVVPVYTGEALSEYQMLEAMLVPSGNNIADALARWAFGSLSAYETYANNYVKQLGMESTHIGSDASGFSPDTTSTAKDLILLGSRVMSNPVLAQIVGMKSVTVPNVGVMNNYDNILGQNGLVGIKTGNSNQAGGVFLGAADTTVNGKQVTIITALMGAPDLNQVLIDTGPLVIATENDFAQTILVNKGEVLGEFKEPWGGIVQVVANNNLVVYVLQGQTAKATLNLASLKIPTAIHSVIGAITSDSNKFNAPQTVSVITVESTSKPTWLWRLTHPESIF